MLLLRDAKSSKPKIPSNPIIADLILFVMLKGLLASRRPSKCGPRGVFFRILPV